MSIASQLQAYENGLTDSYNMVSQKGGTMPVHKNMSALASSIATIPSGGGSFVGIPKEVSSTGVYQNPSSNFTFSLPSDATNIGPDALTAAFNNISSLVAVDMSSVTTISGAKALYNAFNRCSNLASVDMRSLVTVSSESAFYRTFWFCTSLTSVNVGSLATVSGATAFQYTFESCAGLTSISFDSLSSITGKNAFNGAFADCGALTSVSFPKALYFGGWKNQFSSMLSGCQNVTLHFKDGMQSTISTLTGYPNFGGTNTVITFDL